MTCDISLALSTIINADTSVLFIDTCSLLDIIRTPFRDNVKISHLEGAKELLDKVASKKVILIITETVEQELNGHLKATTTDLDRFINKLAASNNNLISVIESVNLSYKFNIHLLSDIKLSNKLNDITLSIINNSHILKMDEECSVNAHNRVILNQAPSQKGKSESKDCLIIEHYLKLAHALRTQSFNKDIVFISSNTSDFGDIQNLRAPLDTQFKEVSMTYCNNFKWAVQELNI